MWCDLYQKAWNWRKEKAKREEMTRVQCIKRERKDAIEESVGARKERDPMPRMQDRKKETIVELGSSSMQTEIQRSTVREEVDQRDVRRTFKMLREVWLNIGVEKVDMHEGITVKVLLDSSATGMFMDKKMTAKHEFKLQKLERLVTVKKYRQHK